MKKLIIGSLVGAILLFGWQTLSWTMLHIHDKAYKYTPSQDSLLATITNTLHAEGQYMLPRVADNASQEDMEKLGKQMDGKPWAVVTLHNAYKYDMVMPIVRGFLIALVCMLLVCQVIQKFTRQTFGSVFVTVMTFALVSFLYVSYNGHNWFKTPWDVLNGELIDTVAGWGLSGLWLGWWYGKK
jgi:hypothetical protein